MNDLDSFSHQHLMKAVKYVGAGDPEVIEVVETKRPVPAAGEVLIKVAAAGLNRADVSQRMGNYPPPPGASDIPGLEISGVIVGRGPGVPEEALPTGARVCALLAGGGYAEYVNVPVGQVMQVPDSFDLVQAAGVPEVSSTVLSNLLLTVPVKEGDWVLVHGGSGGIGTFALQYLRAIGARTIATCSTSEKEQWALEHGAQFTINYREQDFPERVNQMTEGRGVDVILDVVGAAYLAKNVECLADGGRIVVIGLLKGAKAELDLRGLLGKRGGIIATSLRTRSVAEKAEVVSAVESHAWPLIEEGSIRFPIDRVFPLTEARAAHQYFDSGQHMGKVLLRPGDANE